MTLLPLEVEQVVQRCWRRAKRWQAPPEWGREEWYEELLAHARAAAWAAYVAYDPARGVPLEVFLFAQVMGALRSYWRREWQEALHRATPPPLSEDEEESENWESALLSIRQEEKEWQQMVIRLALSQLSKRERLVIELLFWDGNRHRPRIGYQSTDGQQNQKEGVGKTEGGAKGTTALTPS